MLRHKTHFTPGPWSTCKNGECSCAQVWCPDFPVAEVTRGSWGDEYPSLRFNEDSTSLDRKVEAYMEKIEYGSVGEDMAKANARLVAASPDMFAALVAAEEVLEKADRETEVPCAAALTAVKTAIHLALAGRAESYALQETHRKIHERKAHA